jgi:hypothetical protein
MMVLWQLNNLCAANSPLISRERVRQLRSAAMTADFKER